MKLNGLSLPVFLGSLLLVQPLFAQDVDLEKMKKDLSILSKIMKASMSDEENPWGRRALTDHLSPSQIDTLYLQGQGAVLKVRLDMGGFTAFGLHAPAWGNLEFPVVPSAPELPEFDYGWSDEYDEQLLAVQESVEELAEDAIDAMDGVSGVLAEAPLPSSENESELRKLRDEQRDRVKEIRRKTLELRKSMRGKEQLTEAETQKMKEEIQRYQSQLKQANSEYSEKLKKVREEQKKVWSGKLDQFESKLLDTVCEYGGSLRELPDNQFLTLILENADRSGERARDRIYVFKKSDLLACREGRLSKDALKSKSAQYSF